MAEVYVLEAGVVVADVCKVVQTMIVCKVVQTMIENFVAGEL